MSIAHDLPFEMQFGQMPVTQAPSGAAGPRPLHRIADTRRRQGISVRSAARRMQTSMEQVRRQENPSCDMLLSDLRRWQQALEVPIGELLVDSDSPLSEPVLTRARLLRIMKTVRAIKESAASPSIQRFSTMLEQQLIELMPELHDVSAWHSVGQRRSPDELGRTAERVFPDPHLSDSHG
jgi:transcriptional regulator with XRE-family HTH domain